MRVVVVTKDNTDYARRVEEFLTDFTRTTGRELEVMDPETTHGRSFCGVYDIVEYPTVIALSNDGHVQNIWRGLPMPLISEVSYYAKDD